MQSEKCNFSRSHRNVNNHIVLPQIFASRGDIDSRKISQIPQREFLHLANLKQLEQLYVGFTKASLSVLACRIAKSKLFFLEASGIHFDVAGLQMLLDGCKNTPHGIVLTLTSDVNKQQFEYLTFAFPDICFTIV